MHAFSRDFSIIGPVFFNPTQLFCLMPHVRFGLEACLDNWKLPWNLFICSDVFGEFWLSRHESFRRLFVSSETVSICKGQVEKEIE